jgi:hypothetical protein
MIGRIMEIIAGLLVIAFVLVAAVRCTDAEAQQNRVLCRSLTDGETTAVFNGQRCPMGWSFVRHV